MKKLLLLAMVIGLLMITAAQANPINLALTGTATQSSTYPETPFSHHTAYTAIDGVTGGDAYQGQITHTLGEYQPWWQVDLNSTVHLDQIVLWNRTDCCGYRLSNFNVSVLDSQGNTVWTNDFFTGGGYPDPSLTIDLPDNTLGEIVKVRLNGSD